MLSSHCCYFISIGNLKFFNVQQWIHETCLSVSHSGLFQQYINNREKVRFDKQTNIPVCLKHRLHKGREKKVPLTADYCKYPYTVKKTYLIQLERKATDSSLLSNMIGTNLGTRQKKTYGDRWPWNGSTDPRQVSKWSFPIVEQILR